MLEISARRRRFLIPLQENKLMIVGRCRGTASKPSFYGNNRAFQLVHLGENRNACQGCCHSRIKHGHRCQYNSDSLSLYAYHYRLGCVSTSPTTMPPSDSSLQSSSVFKGVLVHQASHNITKIVLKIISSGRV